jgi:predicted ATPase with chaperone activity
LVGIVISRPPPLLDRIDIHIEVPRVAYDKLARDAGSRQ